MFSVDSTVPGAAPRAFDAYRRRWEAQVGDGFALQTLTPSTAGDFRAKVSTARVHDLVITGGYCASAMRTVDTPKSVEDQIQLYTVSQGTWVIGDESGHLQHTVQAGQFLLRRRERPSPFETVPHTAAKIILALSPSALTPLLGKRAIAGSADSAEIRLVVAHANTICTTMADLGPAGVDAAHSALVELIKAVAVGRFDEMEPRLAPALTQAAKDLADSRLADPDLSPAMLARELNVSVRTLQRAFASVEESVTAYIRSRRLEKARLALTASPNRPNLSELAAYWQFADSSHLIRAFKKTYGRTPTEYTRSIESDWAGVRAGAGEP